MADEKKPSGKTRAGGPAKPFPWEEAISEQYERTKSRLKGLATEPEAELQRILEQYLPKKGDSPEERKRKLEELALGFAGTTIGKLPQMIKPQALEAGKQKFLELSKIKDRVYHGTGADVKELRPSKMGALGPGVYVTSVPKEASEYAIVRRSINPNENPNVMPLRIQVENPLNISSVNNSSAEFFKRFDPEGKLSDDEVIKLAKKHGYDAIHAELEGITNIFDPRRIKSDIGNRGTYDITDPDITKKKGGAVKKAEGGTVSYELPDDVTPQNWRDQLETNVLNDARALIGVKEGGPINLDRLLEKAVRKANGGPANLDDMLKWAVAKHNHKMKKGGEVSQTFPLKKDEEEERMFSPAPLKIPAQITEGIEALKRQFQKEGRSMNKPRATTDTGLGIAAEILGSPMNAIGDLGKAIDHVQKTHPLLRKPASVMDSIIEKTPSMGYAPQISFSPEGEMPYGSEHMRELMTRSGMTTGERRPLIEMAGAIMAPFAAPKALKYGKAGVEALAPTAAEMMDFRLGQMMKPYQMGITEGGPKLSKEEYSRMMREKYAAQNLAKQEKAGVALKAEEVKVPADDLGLYSPAEKAAYNLKRNIGTGEAFLSDLRKAPDVGESDFLHTGLEDWLKSKPTVSKQEIQDYMTANRVKLRQHELSGEGVSDDMRFGRGETIDDYDYIRARADDYVYDWDGIGWKPRSEIREEILERHTPDEVDDLIATGRIDDLVEEEVGRLADQLAHDEYYDNPYRSYRNDAGYEIVGNDDVGYSITSPNGDLVNRRDVYDLETAQGVAQQHGMDNGYGGAGSTQYSDYQLSGPSSNYREHITQVDRTTQRSLRERELNELARQMNQATDPIERDRLLNEYTRLKDDIYEIYSGAHHDFEDVMSHSRTQDRVDESGKNILHVDELQSDMHQDGAEFGYKTPALREAQKRLEAERETLLDEFRPLRDKLQDLTDAQTRAAYREGADQNNLPFQKEYNDVKAQADEIARKIEENGRQLSDMDKAVPDAPFKKDWAEKEFKKLLTLAAKEGKDGITLSRWQDQLERWGTDSLAFKRTKTGEWTVAGTKSRPPFPLNAEETVSPKEVAQAVFNFYDKYDVNSKESLRNFIKSTLARGWSNAHIDRVTNKAWDQMQNLKPGEMAAIDPRKDGFKATYGKAYVEMMQKMARKYGGKITTTRIDKGKNELIDVPFLEISGNLQKSSKKGFPYKKGGRVTKADLEQQFRMAFGGGVFNTDPDITDSGQIIPERT